MMSRKMKSNQYAIKHWKTTPFFLFSSYLPQNRLVFVRAIHTVIVLFFLIINIMLGVLTPATVQRRTRSLSSTKVLLIVFSVEN